MRDPKKAEQNQEVMALYKQEGVNPVGGCLPMIVQLPFFYAFYRVLSIAIELRHAPWLWVPDLSSPESLPHPPSADHPDRHAIPDAEDDAGGGRGPESAENDDVHAADVRLHVLLRFRRACTILVNRKPGRNRAAADYQQVHAYASTPRPPPAVEGSREKNREEIDRMKYTVESLRPKLDQFPCADSRARWL